MRVLAHDRHYIYIYISREISIEYPSVGLASLTQSIPLVGQYGEIFCSRHWYCPSLRSGRYGRFQTESPYCPPSHVIIYIILHTILYYIYYITLHYIILSGERSKPLTYVTHQDLYSGAERLRKRNEEDQERRRVQQLQEHGSSYYTEQIIMVGKPARDLSFYHMVS